MATDRELEFKFEKIKMQILYIWTLMAQIKLWVVMFPNVTKVVLLIIIISTVF